MNADALARIKKYDTAIRMCNRGLNEFKGHYLILNLRGCLYAKMKLLDNALLDFNKVTKVKPSFADGHCERWKWQGELTLEIGAMTFEEYVIKYGRIAEVSATDSEDLWRVQSAMWGKIGH